MLRDTHTATRTSAPAIPADLDTTDDGALPWEAAWTPAHDLDTAANDNARELAR